MVPLLVLTLLAGGFLAARLAARRRAAVHPSFRSVTKGLVAVGLILLGLGPTTWHPNNTTLLVPLDGEVRVQFQFRNDPP